MFDSVSICTLGCRVNHFESEAIADAARRNGINVVKWGGRAELAIVNSCALTTLAESKTRQAMRGFARKNPDSPIAITGCYAQTAADALARIENVKWIIGSAAKLKSIDIVLNNPPKAGAQVFMNAPSEAERALMTGGGPLEDRMNLKIQDGCDNACSYCIIPRARGLPKSRNFDEIVADARNLVSRGVREIILTGINIAKFKSEKGGMVDLIDELAQIKNLLRIRMGSIEPPHFNLGAMLERMADSAHPLCPNLHLSAQSLSDKVLEAMRRRYTAEEFLDTLRIAKEKIPDISIGSDIICGHPGEGEEEFLETRRKLAESGLAYLHVFTFSPRPKTLAAAMRGTPPKPLRKSRADNLRALGNILSKNFLKPQIGGVRTVLLENRLSNGDYLAHTDNYIQVAVKIDEPNLKNRLAAVRLLKEESSETVRAELVKLI